jgi:hypothetical protein
MLAVGAGVRVAFGDAVGTGEGDGGDGGSVGIDDDVSAGASAIGPQAATKLLNSAALRMVRLFTL